MKLDLTIEVVVGDDLLYEVTAAFRTMSLWPECFVWSIVTGSDEARIWMIVASREERLTELAERFRQIRGVNKILLHRENDRAMVCSSSGVVSTELEGSCAQTFTA